MGRRALIAGTAAAIAAAVLALGGAFRPGGASAEPDHLPTAVVEEFQRGFSAGDTEAEIAGLQAELRARPHDVKALETLGLAYLQRVRETGDASYYPKADGILREALRFRPHDLIATAGLGQLALARHQFRRALALGLEAKAISPTTAGVYGVIGDANVELGRYPQAFAAFDRMAALKPSVASYARVSYARELLGRPASAERAMALAASAAVGEREAYAWTRVQLGLIELSTGRPRAAARELRAALASFPGYAFALDGMAQAEAALGRLRKAASYERAAVARVPLPQYVATLGDLEAATGRPTGARREYALIAVIERLLAANGVRNDLDIALFDADHGRNPAHAVELARKGHAERPSIVGDDVLGWALARAGRCAEALPYSQRSLRLGTKDALKLFHRGYVAACLGRPAEARTFYRRALAVNPHFSILWAPVARKGATS
ncbi:MAG: tetratricopeptide repeat protein [Gaiellaceae bacterium]